MFAEELASRLHREEASCRLALPSLATVIGRFSRVADTAGVARLGCDAPAGGKLHVQAAEKLIMDAESNLALRQFWLARKRYDTRCALHKLHTHTKPGPKPFEFVIDVVVVFYHLRR